MSGPIVRKYGFPNFDKIFGERPLEHGVDDEKEPGEEQKTESSAPPPKKTATKKEVTKPKKS